jgi:pyocin large subunit-like protein
MSWQATAWAVKQQTGAAGCKLLLLTLANYADADGCCWPAQEVLAADTEQSVDTVQRQLRKLEKAGLIRAIPRPMGPGRWPSRTYFLSMPVAEISKPQSAAQSDDAPNRSERNETVTSDASTMPQGARDHAAPGPVTMPHQARDHAAPVRHEPSLNHHLEPSLEPSSAKTPKKT